MWIERLELIGFGKIAGQAIDFQSGRLNLIVRPNEYGKSTIADAIWAILYGCKPENTSYEGDPGCNHKIARQPRSGATFKGCLDLNLDGRKLRVVRDLDEDTARVLDLSRDLAKADSDVTSEYLLGRHQNELGQRLSGLSRDLFKATCMILQGELDKLPFSGDESLSQVWMQIADSAGAAHTAASAVACLEKMLVKFPYQDATYELENLIGNLEREQLALVERIKQLEQEHNQSGQSIQRLAFLEDQIATKSSVVNADEYYQLREDMADIESRLARAQDKTRHLGELSEQVSDLADAAEFPIERRKHVEELWLKRSARQQDRERLQGELQKKRLEAQGRDLEFRERAGAFAHFTLSDTQVMQSLSGNLRQVSAEIVDLKRQHVKELAEINAAGVDLAKLESIRSILTNLEGEDLDEAHLLNAMRQSHQGRIDECQELAAKSRSLLNLIEGQKKGEIKRLQSVLSAIKAFDVVAASAFVYLLVINQQLLGGIAMLLAAVACTAGAVVTGIAIFLIFYVDKHFRATELGEIQSEERKYLQTAQDTQQKLTQTEVRVEELSRRLGIANGAMLLQYVDDYEHSAVLFKELDVLDQMIAAKEGQEVKLRAELQDYFNRAGKPALAVTPQSAQHLAEAIAGSLDDHRKLQSSTDFLSHREAELKFLEDELKDLHSLLIDHFQKAGLKFANVEEGYKAFTNEVSRFRQWESVSKELRLLEQDTTSDLTASELPAIIERLEKRRQDVASRLENMIDENPQLSFLADQNDQLLAGGQWATLRATVEDLRRERDELALSVRAATFNYDEYYLKTMDELEALEENLERLRQHRLSLLLARDTFKRLSQETHTNWATSLTQTAREVLKHVNADIDSLEFSGDLSISVKMKGARAPLSPWELNHQISAGTREQIHWLARLAVIKYLSGDRSLPIILDEPFSEFDDARFLASVRFLLNAMVKTNQIVMFSCHQERHRWLMEQLTPVEHAMVHVTKLEPLKSDARFSSRL